MTQLAAPTVVVPPKRVRLAGVDAARGLALLGMISLHALYEADAAGNPTWSVTVFSGRASAAFALLMGVGIAFVTGRRQVRAADRRAVATMIAVRALAIGVIGFLLGGSDTVMNAVILPYLAVVFLFAIPLVFLRTWVVAAIGLLLAAVGPVACHVLLPRLPEPDLGNPTFGRLADDPAGMLIELSFTGFYPSQAWLAYVCAGLVIGRLDLTKVRVAATLLAGGTVLAVWANAVSALLLHRFGGLAHIWAAQPGSGLTEAQTTELLTFGGNGATPSSTWWWLAVNTPHTSTPLDLLGAAGCAAAVLGLLLLAGHVGHRVLRPLCTVVLVPLAAAGSMTLTFYAAHVLFINSEFDTYTAATGCLVQVIGAVLIGLAVRGTVGRGPLEAAVTALAGLARRWAASRGAVQVAAPIPVAAPPVSAVPVSAVLASAVPVSAVPASAVPVSAMTTPVAAVPVGVVSQSAGPDAAGTVAVRSDGVGVVSGGSDAAGSARAPAPRRPHRIARRRARPGTGQGSGP